MLDFLLDAGMVGMYTTNSSDCCGSISESGEWCAFVSERGNT